MMGLMTGPSGMLLLAKVLENHIVQMLQTQLSPGKHLFDISNEVG